jgi:hypothetical protein
MCKSEKPKCPICARDHDYQACPDKTQIKCANCGEPHSAGYKGCSSFKESQSINRLVATQGLSYRDAAAQVKRPQTETNTPQGTNSQTTEEISNGVAMTKDKEQAKVATENLTQTITTENDENVTEQYLTIAPVPSTSSQTKTTTATKTNQKQQTAQRGEKPEPKESYVKVEQIIHFITVLMKSIITQTGAKINLDFMHAAISSLGLDNASAERIVQELKD